MNKLVLSNADSHLATTVLNKRILELRCDNSEEAKKEIEQLQNAIHVLRANTQAFMGITIKHNVNEIWRVEEGSKVLWKLQAPKGVMTFKTKKQALAWQRASIDA